MDPYVRQLTERLLDPGQPLSRNRHFHTFDNDEGSLALRIARRLKALAKDIASCHAQGGQSFVRTTRDADGVVKVEVRLEKLRSHRTTSLDPAEYELLQKLPGVAQALDGH